MSVLHARQVEVRDLAYGTGPGDAAVVRMRFFGTQQQAHRLKVQIERRVDILDVTVEPTAGEASCTGAPGVAFARSDMPGEGTSACWTKARPEPAV